MTSLKYLLITMRPRQWTKNLIVFLALIFSINLYWDPANLTELTTLLLKTAAAFVLFCLISSADYLINDIVDMESDRAHPVKRNRPLASNKLSRNHAVAAAALLIVVGIVAASVLSLGMGVVLSFYLVT
ncbi:MAG: UbiA family prenyltransferase, partial [Chloroflexota bacterium]